MFIIKNPQTIYSKKSNPTDNRFSRVGQWRKDIAIAYKNDPIYREEVPCLINKEREIIYEGNCNEGYPDEIYRTSKGYYLVYYYKDISAPGKDSRYSGPYLKKVISEDGKSQIWAYGFEYKVFKNEWYDTKDKNVFITKDMGDGIVEHNNSLYRLEDFKKIGDLPKKFKIESIFEDGLCLLSVPKDNRDYFVIVKNGEIDNFFEVNDTNKLISLIDKTNDTSIIKYCTNNKSPIIRVLKKQQDKVDDYIADEFYNYLFSHGRFRISDNPFTAEDFESGIDLDKNEIDFIKNFHWKLSQNKRIEDDERYIVRLRTNEDISGCHILCLFFETFIILCFSHPYEKEMYKFYSLDGKCLSNKTYYKIGNTKNFYSRKIEEDFDFQCKNFIFKNSNKDEGAIIIKDGKLYENRFPDYMFNDKSNHYDVHIHEHYISFNGELYDFFFNKISINYVDIKIEEVIKKYLYRLTPNFKIYERPSLWSYVCLEMNISGKICLPIPRKLNTIYSELKAKKENIPNHIKEINHIRDYIDENGKHYSLYIFKCRPEAYCDKQGHIIYNFNPDKIEL